MGGPCRPERVAQRRWICEVRDNRLDTFHHAGPARKAQHLPVFLACQSLCQVPAYDPRGARDQCCSLFHTCIDARGRAIGADGRIFSLRLSLYGRMTVFPLCTLSFR